MLAPSDKQTFAVETETEGSFAENGNVTECLSGFTDQCPSRRNGVNYSERVNEGKSGSRGRSDESGCRERMLLLKDDALKNERTEGQSEEEESFLS